MARVNGGLSPQRSLSRSETAPHIKKGVQRYWNKKGFSAHFEVGVNKGGRLIADCLLINMKRQLVMVEVKSCWSDFYTDHSKGKWPKYLTYADKFYFGFLDQIWENIGDQVLEAIEGSGAGVMIIPTDGRRIAHVVKPAKTLKGVDEDTRLWLLTKLACKAGAWN